MNNSQNSDAGDQVDRNDPLLGMAAAVRDVWMLGASAIGGMLAQGNAANGSPASAYFQQLLPPASAFRDLIAANIGAWPRGLGGPTNGGHWSDVAALAIRAEVAATVSGLRYWSKLAQIYGTHQVNIARSLSASVSDPTRADKERLVLIDEVRAYLREVGDLSVQEARALQSELEKLAAEAAAAASGAEGTSEYKRRWKMKR
jgi:hypothetical protein